MPQLLFLSGAELMLALFAILILFGTEKIPEIARGLGKGMNEFKRATDEIKREINIATKDMNKEIKNIKEDINKDADN